MRGEMGEQEPEKWTTEEEKALKAGVAKYGPGRWKEILADSGFASELPNRLDRHLEEKWRYMNASSGLGGGETSTTFEAETTTSTAEAPNTQETSSTSQDNENVSTYNSMIFEALSSLNDPRGSDLDAIVNFIKEKQGVPPKFRKKMSSKLGKLVQQGKLEKVEQCYKIKEEAVGTNTPSPEQKDIGPRLQEQSSLTTSGNLLEDAADRAAALIVEAAHKESLAAAAVKNAERISQMAEESEAMLALAEELAERCSKGEQIIFK